MTRAGLSALALPGTDAPIIDELAQASDTNPITRVLADAALLDLDRYATGRGLHYSRVGTTLMLAAPSEQRLTDAIDTIAATAINTGARVTDLTAQYIDDEKALASVGLDPWTTRPSDDPTGQAVRILYVGRDGAHIHVKAGRIIAYDIADNKRRLRVAKTLESWGYRIQESVFQLRLDTATLARVRARLAALMSEGDDVVHIYPICSSCADRADILGAAIALDDVGLCRGCDED